MTHTLRESVQIAARRPEVLRAVQEVYDELQKEIDARRPVCVVSGRCCRFEEYGHRLYVTTVELAAFLTPSPGTPGEASGCLDDCPRAGRGEGLPLVAARTVWDGTGCPFQVNKLCSVHAIRPFGCRIYFCDATAKQWQEDLYERLHARLKQVHDDFQIPYFYVEWRSALRELGLAREGEAPSEPSSKDVARTAARPPSMDAGPRPC